MALTTEFIGTRITDCSTTTGWDNDTIAAVAVDTVTTIQNSNSIATQASNKDGWIHYDYSGTGSFDWTATTGTDLGKHVYIWINLTTPGIVGNAGTAGSNGQGMYIMLSSNDVDFACYTIHGGDYLDRYNGGWKRFVIDPSKTPTSYIGTAGNINWAAISRFGVGIETNASARADNLFIDAIDVGTGIRAYGTSTTDDGWGDVIADDMETTTNVWGILQEVDGVLFSYGSLEIGDNVSTNTTAFTDNAKVIKWVNPEYFVSAAWASAVDSDLMSLKVVGNATGTTSFTDGKIVGSDNGRNGNVYIGSDGATTTVDLHDGTNAGNDVNLYGTNFTLIAGGINWGNDADHVFYGGAVSQCGQFDPVGAPIIRNCNFINTTNIDSALLWNSNIDIQSCNFIANTTGAAIEHDATGSPTYTDLIFSGNTYDVLNSTAGLVAISASGTTNVSSHEETGGGSTTISNVKSLTVTVKDETNTAVEGVQVYIQKASSETAELGHPGNPYTSHITNNVIGDATFDIQETIESDNPSAGWLVVKETAGTLSTEQTYRYASYSTPTYTLKTEVTGTDNGTGTTTVINETGIGAKDIVEGDTIRNTTDTQWAVVLSVDTNSVTTTTLSGGASWASDNYSVHRLALTYDGDDTATVPIMNQETNVSGIATVSYNYGASMDVVIRIRQSSATTKYIPYRTSATISGDLSITAVLTKDTIIT